MTAPLFEFEETSVDLLTGLCRPRQHQTIALQGIPRPHRHNPEVGIMSSAGLVPMLVLARLAGLARLADQHLSVPTDKGANAGLKVASLVAGMVAGADSIDDMAVLRHGGSRRNATRGRCAVVLRFETQYRSVS